jgi:16S rRNA (cytosine967-C5)-methyltransferase
MSKRKVRNLPATPRNVAAEILRRVIYEDAFAGRLIQSNAQLVTMSDPDRRLCVELIYGTLRWRDVIRNGLRAASKKPNQKINPKILPHLLVAGYQIQFLGERIPKRAAVHEAVESVKRIRKELSGFANGLLRHVGPPAYLDLQTDASLETRAQAFGIPLLLAEETVARIDKHNWNEALMALNERPEVGVTFLGEDSEEALFQTHLSERGIQFRPHPFVEKSYLLSRPGAIPDLPFFSEGLIQIQDPGSLLAAQLMSVDSGDSILDLCAAPGGKSVVLAKAVGPSGRLIAAEQHPGRAEKIAENASRTKTSIEICLGDVRETVFQELNQYDGALLDAPCTGLGTTRRKPEVKWKDIEASVRELSSLQWELLVGAAKLIKPGGSLVYSVCSPMAAEGSTLIERFLENNTEFSIQDPRDILPNLPSDALDPDLNIRLRNHLHLADAFFMTRLKRR